MVRKLYGTHGMGYYRYDRRFLNYAMPQCWFSAMMAQMPEDVSIPLLDIPMSSFLR